MHQMHYPPDSVHMHLCDLLAHPSLVHRCAELGLLIDRCTTKDLQHFFPLLVHSIFGTASPSMTPNNSFAGGAGAGGAAAAAAGWGLRTCTGLANAHEFDVLYSFFLPMGPMFRLCYRLLGDGGGGAAAARFEVPIEQLPPKTAEMLYGGRYAAFYADAVCVDAAQRQIVALQLNAFDYFLLHFALHGMQPLHLQHALAMDVHHEKRKTLYIYLVADYMCTFLPSHPEAAVMPVNVPGGWASMAAGGGVGGVGAATSGGSRMGSVMQPMHQPAVQHARSPKYLKLSALQPNIATNSNAPSSPLPMFAGSSPQTTHHLIHNTSTGSHHSAGGGGHGSPGVAHPTPADIAACWRTESALHLFVDTWLRCDVTAHLHLPSSEFVRAVRICVKQLHAFANAADLDHNAAMAALRASVPAMIAAPTYALLRTLIRRWPMDSSFAVVLELWLSYVQPWRYSFERIHGQQAAAAAAADAAQIQRRFEPFVRDQLPAYTQILVQLLPLFERLNFATLKNVLMMSRLLKVFAQANLPELLRAAEFEAWHQQHQHSASATASPAQQRGLRQRSPGVFRPPTPGSPTGHDGHEHGGGDDRYVCLFGDEVRQQIAAIGRRMQLARRTELERAARLVAAERRRSEAGSRWRRWARWLVLCDDEAVAFAQQLADCRKIPELLAGMLGQLQQIFDVALPVAEEEMMVDGADGEGQMMDGVGGRDWSGREMLLDETTDGNRSWDMSMSGWSGSGAAGSAAGQRGPPNCLTYTVDPAVVPAQAHELAVLVRVLYELAATLNRMYGAQLERGWRRRDLLGRCARQLLSAPLRVHSFDKSQGVSRVCERRLGPRVNLRPLASWQAIVLVAASFAGGWLWCGVPSAGFVGLLLLAGAYVLAMALVADACGDGGDGDGADSGHSGDGVGNDDGGGRQAQ